MHIKESIVAVSSSVTLTRTLDFLKTFVYSFMSIVNMRAKNLRSYQSARCRMMFISTRKKEI